MGTRVYKYGLVPIGYQPKETIEELYRANKLWNALVQINRENLAKWDDARCRVSEEYRSKLDELDSIKECITQAYDALRAARQEEGTKDESNPRLKVERAVIERLKADKKVIESDLDRLRKEANKQVDTKTLNDEFRAECNRAKSVWESGVYSVTGDAILDYFKTAKKEAQKKGRKPKIQKFDGTGYYAIRFRRTGAKVDGISVDDLMQGNFESKPRLKVLSTDHSRKKPRIRVSCAMTAGRTKAQHEFDWIYHRPLPPDAQIQNGKILRTRTGDKFRYDLVLTIKVPEPKTLNPSDLKGVIGFRKLNGNLLIGTVKSDNPTEAAQALLAPQSVVSAMEHVQKLQGELDDSAADLGRVLTPKLKEERLAEDHPNFRLWRSIVKLRSNETLSYEKAYKFARMLQRLPDLFSNDINNLVHQWWRGNSRKYREIHNPRKKQLTHSKHYYREIAAAVVAQKKLIVLEDINLNDFAETRDKDTKRSNQARAQRFSADLSEFRDAIKNAVDREGVPYKWVHPAYTSKMCSACGELNRNLKSEKEWTCPMCGVVHDRDENAALNLIKLGKIHLEEVKK